MALAARHPHEAGRQPARPRDGGQLVAVLDILGAPDVLEGIRRSTWPGASVIRERDGYRLALRCPAAVPARPAPSGWRALARRWSPRPGDDRAYHAVEVTISISVRARRATGPLDRLFPGWRPPRFTIEHAARCPSKGSGRVEPVAIGFVDSTYVPGVTPLDEARAQFARKAYDLVDYMLDVQRHHRQLLSAARAGAPVRDLAPA